MGCRLSLRFVSTCFVRRSFDKICQLLARLYWSTLCFKNIMQIFDKILLIFLFISFVPLLSVNCAPNLFCFSIFCLGESPQIVPQVLQFLPYLTAAKNTIFQKFLDPPLMHRPPPSKISFRCPCAEGLGLDYRAGQIGTVLPTARHRCNVSVFPGG